MSEVTLGALSDAGVLEIGDGYRTKRSEHGQPGYRILRVADVADGRISREGGDFVRAEYSRAIGAKRSQPGDVLLTTKGTVGRVAVYPPDAEPVVYSPQLCYFRVKEPRVLDARYLAYWFKSESFKRQASHRANNTDMAAYLNLRDIRSLQLTVASIERQKAIADILGALDDKIAANERLTTVVDELLAANLTSMSAGRATVTLSSIARVNVTSTKPVPGGSLRYLDISSVRQGGYAYPEESPWEDAPGRARRVISKFDTVWSTVRPNRRSHALVLDDDPLLVASTGLAVLTPNERRSAGLYEASRTPGFESFLLSVAEGSAYPAVRADRFAEAPIPALSDAEWDEFEAFALPSRERAHSAQVESRRLASTRDELLPLLMSGKVRIKEVEGVV